MYKPLILRFRHNTAQLKKKYLSCADGKEKSYWQAIWLLSRRDLALTKQQVSTLTGYNIDWVRKTMHRYNQGTDDAMTDGRKNNRRPRLISGELQRELTELIRADRPSDRGLWSGPKVAQWIEEATGKPVRPITGWRTLRYCGFSLQIPRPHHTNGATQEARNDFKKNFPSPYKTFRRIIRIKPSKSGPKTNAG